MPTPAAIFRQTLEHFTTEFLHNPYLCYTEHGLHARFYAQLYDALTPDQRYLTWQSQRVCVVQKEYPTAHHLGKPRRQHWDIALLQNPPDHSQPNGVHTYDYLRLAAVVEFGMNAHEAHLLMDDIARLSCASLPVVAIGREILRSRLGGGLQADCVERAGGGVGLWAVGGDFYGMADGTRTHENGVWRIVAGEVVSISI